MWRPLDEAFVFYTAWALNDRAAEAGYMFHHHLHDRRMHKSVDLLFEHLYFFFRTFSSSPRAASTFTAQGGSRRRTSAVPPPAQTRGSLRDRRSRFCLHPGTHVLEVQKTETSSQ